MEGNYPGHKRPDKPALCLLLKDKHYRCLLRPKEYTGEHVKLRRSKRSAGGGGLPPSEIDLFQFSFAGQQAEAPVFAASQEQV